MTQSISSSLVSCLKYESIDPSVAKLTLDGQRSLFIVHAPINKKSAISLDLSGHSVIVAAPIKADTQDVIIKAHNLFLLSEIHAKTGKFTSQCSGQMYAIGADVKSQGDLKIVNKKDIHIISSINDFSQDACSAIFDTLNRRCCINHHRDHRAH